MAVTRMKCITRFSSVPFSTRYVFFRQGAFSVSTFSARTPSVRPHACPAPTASSIFLTAIMISWVEGDDGGSSITGFFLRPVGGGEAEEVSQALQHVCSVKQRRNCLVVGVARSVFEQSCKFPRSVCGKTLMKHSRSAKPLILPIIRTLTTRGRHTCRYELV